MPPEYQDDPDLYWAIQASLTNDNQDPSGLISGGLDQNQNSNDDPLDIMINKTKSHNENAAKTPSTAEHNSDVKGNVSFESNHANM